MLTNIRRFTSIRGTMRGREVEFLWDDGSGRRLGSVPSDALPLIVDALTRAPLDWTLTNAEWLALTDAVIAP